MAKAKEPAGPEFRRVHLEGLTPIMFDRYLGDNKTQATPEQRLYLGQPTSAKGPRPVIFPTENIWSFLTAINTTSAPKRLLDPRSYGRICSALQAFLLVRPEQELPFLRDGKPILFEGLDETGRDHLSGIWAAGGSAPKLPKGIPNPKIRPVLMTPWALEFELCLYANPDVGWAMLENLLKQGGLVVGLGTHRPRFGRFEARFA